MDVGLLRGTGRIVLSGIIALIGVSDVYGQDCTNREATASFGAWKRVGYILNSKPNGRFKRLTPQLVNMSEVSGWRLQIEDKTVASAKWALVVRDGVGRPLSIMRKSAFSENGSTLWTEIIRAPQLSVEIIGLAPSDGDTVVKDVIAYERESGDIRLFSTKSAEPDWADAYDQASEGTRLVSDAVGMFVTSMPANNGHQEGWSCTGVLIANGLFLTNWHCGGKPDQLSSSLFWNTQVRRNCLVDFRWDGGATRSQFSCKALVSKNKTLDYAVIELGTTADGPRLEALPVPVRISAAEPTGEIFMVHHARSLSKRLSSNCRVVEGKVRPATFAHNCDTDPGASGAPVFDENNDLVGLHHAGFIRDEFCNVLESTNEAIRIGAIVEDVCKSSDGRLSVLCGH